MKKVAIFIANLGISPDMDQLSKIDFKRINLFTFLLALVLIIDSFKDLYFGFNICFVVLSLLGYIQLCLFFFTNIRYKPLLNLVNLEFILFTIFIFSAIAGFENGLFLYYFLIMMASLFFFFNNKNTLKYNAVIFTTVLALFIINHYYGYKLFAHDALDLKSFYKKQRLITFLQVFIGIIIIGVFMISKRFAIIKIYNQAIVDKTSFVELENQIQTKKQAAIEDLVKLAISNDHAFIPKFKQVYIDFYDKLSSINPKLTAEDYKFCALLKLGFSTKEISTYNHLAIRSVQTKKNRLRKSFNIPSNEDLYLWVNNL